MKKFTKTVLGLGLILVGSVAMAQCDNTNGNAWGQYNNPDNKMNVTASAAMGGTSCGLELEVKNQNGGQASRHYVQDGSPTQETRYRAAFCVDPNSLPMETSGPNRRIKIHQAQCGGGACDNSDIVQIKVESVSAGQYRLDMFVRENGAPYNKSRHFVNIPDAPTRIEYDLDLAAGTFKLWVNATSESDPRAVELTGLDTSTKWPFITRARLGSMDKSNNAGIGSTFYLDEFESRRQTFIGGTCN